MSQPTTQTAYEDARYTKGSSAVEPTSEADALTFALTSMAQIISRAELARRENYKRPGGMDVEAHSRLTRMQQIATAAAAELRGLGVSASPALLMAAE